MTEQPEKKLEALYQQDHKEEEEVSRQPEEPKAHKETVTSEEATGTLPPKSRSRLERLEQKKAQIENQIKAIHACENAKTRRERTRRLIQIGALSEKYFTCEGIEPKEYEALLKQIVAEEKVKAILKKS
jgi:hypothetical protein